MALQQAEAFVQTVLKEEELHQKFNHLNELSHEEASAYIITTGKSLGFEFTSEEFNEAWNKQPFDMQNPELSERELEEVGGGTGMSVTCETYCTCIAACKF